MAKLELDFDTRAPADKVIEALTDFSPERPKRWPNLTPEMFEVYQKAGDKADVKEGSKAPFTLWAREAYDWSTPGTVTWTIRESNFCKPGSYVRAEVTPRDGASHVHVTWDRTPSNLRGRIIVQLMRLSKGKVFTEPMKEALDRLA